MRGRRRKSTTCRDERLPPAPDLVDRRFLAASPDRLWLADMTYVPTKEGFLYLSFILDACTRKVVGWSMSNHLRTELGLPHLHGLFAFKPQHLLSV
jgi:putative transposase